MMIAAAHPHASTAGGTVLAIVLVAVVFAAYWAPAFTGLVRGVPNLGSVVVVNAFLGWTVIGWVAALALACRSVPPPAPGWQGQRYGR